MQEREPGPDPIRRAWTNSPVLTRVFLKDGELLKPIQRAGIILISLFIVGSGINLFSDAVATFRSGDSGYLNSGGPAVFLLVFGGLGLRNALRFKRR